MRRLLLIVFLFAALAGVLASAQASRVSVYRVSGSMFMNVFATKGGGTESFLSFRGHLLPPQPCRGSCLSASWSFSGTSVLMVGVNSCTNAAGVLSATVPFSWSNGATSTGKATFIFFPPTPVVPPQPLVVWRGRIVSGLFAGAVFDGVILPPATIHPPNPTHPPDPCVGSVIGGALLG